MALIYKSMPMKSLLGFAPLYFFCELVCGQCDPTILGPDNSGGYTYPYLREANVLWAKRVWRVIDMREKVNHPLYFPLEAIGNQKNLATLLRDEVLNGSLLAYSPLRDDFSVVLSADELLSVFVKKDTLWSANADGEKIANPIRKAVDMRLVKRVRVKEDWFFDPQRSVMEVRIIGLCPVIESYDDEGNYRGDQPLFWVYFPKCICALEHNLAFTNNNDAQAYNYFQLFSERRFSSYIYMESNVRGAAISDYTWGKDALLEAENIKNKIRKTEEDFWEY